MSTTTAPSRLSLPERTVAAITSRLARRSVSRRRFLTRLAVVGSALAVDPIRYVFRPQSALATVCGSGASCNSGWTAFCCTINGGANTCPPGSYAAGWWKVDASAFCHGLPRYYIDCNRLPDASCRCTCADGECDKRKVCCNVFRYGQCNQHVPTVTEVVCRVITCTVPWEWDPSCTSTVRTDNNTRSHSATCLPGTDASWIELKYQDLGLVGSTLGRQIGGEYDIAGGGRRAYYDYGSIVWRDDLGASVLDGPFAPAWDNADGPTGPLGYPIGDPSAVGSGRVQRYEGGAVTAHPDHGVHAVHGAIGQEYLATGGVGGYLGWPVSDIEPVEGPWLRLLTSQGHQVVQQTETGEVRVLAASTELPPDGTWPGSSMTVERWHGRDRVRTAIAVTERSFSTTSRLAFLASSQTFADAMAGGVAAAMRSAPLLLTDPAQLSSALYPPLIHLEVDRIIVLGGARAVAPAVLEELRERGFEVGRWAGDTRYATAVTVSRRLFPTSARTVFVATGTDFADALAAVPAAVADNAPLLLTEPAALPDVVATEIRRLQPARIVVLGGSRAVRPAVVDALAELAPEITRVAGDSRYATAAAMATGDAPVDTVFIASGVDFPDALAAGAAGARLGAPVLLTEPDRIPDETWAALDRLAPNRIVIVGGTSAVNEAVARKLGSLAVSEQSS